MSVPSKALTIRQPYADAILRQWKRWELRTQRTKFRGEFVVHSARQWAPNLELEVLYTCKGINVFTLPRGCGLGVARVVDCIPIEEFAINNPGVNRAFYPPDYQGWAWQLEVVDVWAQPVPAKGALGFWRWAA